LDFEFWKGKRVFLTGHTGFKGSWLTQWLEMMGAIVYGYSLPPEKEGLHGVLWPEGIAHYVYGDVRDFNTLLVSLLSSKPDIIFHLAAQPLVGVGYSRPVETFDTNFMGTLNLYEACRAFTRKEGFLPIIITITTDKVYANAGNSYGFREDDILGGMDPYSASKACVELLTDSYRYSYFGKGEIAIVTARAGNVFGGGDWAQDRLIPDCIRAFKKGVPATIRNPGSIRPWQHVLDALHGYLLLAEKLWNGVVDQGAWNFGPYYDDLMTTEDVVKELLIWPNSSFTYKEGESFKEVNNLLLDSSKANRKLGWKPIQRTREALHATVSEYYQLSKKTIMDRIAYFMKRVEQND
jgi:CDP-glucose 4,6-dehydratase